MLCIMIACILAGEEGPHLLGGPPGSGEPSGRLPVVSAPRATTRGA